MSSHNNSPLVLVYYWGALMSSSNGSQVRTLGQLAFVCEQFDNVVLYTYSDHPTDSWTSQQVAEFGSRFPNVRLVTDNEGTTLRIINKLKKATALAVPRAARHVFRLSLPFLTPNYHKICKDAKEILYLVNYVDGIAQLNGVDGEKAVVETHDLRYFRRAKGTNDSIISFKNLFRLRYEISTLSAVRALVAITRNEAYFYRNMLPSSEIYYVPEYQPAELGTVVEDGGFDYDLLFAASGNVLNVEGLQQLFEIVGPRVRAFRIALCGLICERPEIKELAAAYPNITMLNFVTAEALRDLYARSKACLSPADGTGLSVKLVEALRHRKPVFASQSAREGLMLDCTDCVFPLDPDVMTAVLSDREKLRAASAAAASCYRRFSSNGDLENFREALRRISASKREARARGPAPASVTA